MAILLIFFLLTGCSSVGDWLSRPSGPSSGLAYPAQFDHIIIGVTKQAEVRGIFGTPTDIQTSVKGGARRETWAYAHASPSINPFQYLPVFGVLALTPLQESQTFSVSFGSDGIVDGISVRDVQPYGSVASSTMGLVGGREVKPYGMNNPMVYHVNRGLPGQQGLRAN